MNYLLVTHIPFCRDRDGAAVIDGLWARDLLGLVASFRSVRVAAPQYGSLEEMGSWGPNAVTLQPVSGIAFVGFLPVRTRKDVWRWVGIRRVLRQQVAWADLVHTSNLFPPYLGLSYAHRIATVMGKKTLFVVAEDFKDMLEWEWVRTSKSSLQRWRRKQQLAQMEALIRRSARTATLTLLHTPAAVLRYRLDAKHGLAIRQPGHSAADVIRPEELDARLNTMAAGGPLKLVCACRHSPLKGLDFLIEAIALARNREVPIQAVLYGKGPDTQKLGALVAKLGLQQCVLLPGTLDPGEELNSALAAADIFVMAHRTNDFGRAFFDAMAAGLPVLAFRTPASAGTVYEGIDGFLTPLDDVQGLAERLAWLYGHRELLAQASRAARERALANTRDEWFKMRADWIQGLFE